MQFEGVRPTTVRHGKQPPRINHNGACQALKSRMRIAGRQTGKIERVMGTAFGDGRRAVHTAPRSPRQGKPTENVRGDLCAEGELSGHASAETRIDGDRLELAVHGDGVANRGGQAVA